LEPLRIAPQRVVELHFDLLSVDGELLDSTRGEAPLLYLHGSGQFVPGLERALEGCVAGDKLKVTVPPEDGFGVCEGEGPRPYPRSAFPPGLELEPGMEFTVGDEADGEEQVVVWVTDVTDDQVFVDVNHPLAGETLTFDVEILTVRTATPDELSHGHAHGPHGHHH
jgi:FKBP-type peptidyl-prolyl cis-trans isomerase SlyD